MSVGLRIAATSHVGSVRTGNEDAGLATNHLLLVADGMGGHAAGEVASSIVARTVGSLLDEYPTSEDAVREWLVNGVNLAHERIGDVVASNPELRGMGTTCTTLALCDQAVVVGHVGDSRAYRLGLDGLTQLSIDHTYVQMLVESGEITAEQATRHPRRNLLMRAIDGVHEAPMDLTSYPVEIGQRFLLCSDGLTGVLSDAVISELLALPDLTLAVSQLIEYSLAAGAPDNVTVVIGEVVEDAEDFSPLYVGSAETESAPVAEEMAPAKRRHWPWVAAAVLVLGFAALSTSWLAQQWYVGDHEGKLAIYQGIPQTIGPIPLSRLR